MRTNEILMEQVASYKRLNSEQANKIAARDVTIGALKESLGTYQDKVDKGVIELRDKNNSIDRLHNLVSDAHEMYQVKWDEGETMEADLKGLQAQTANYNETLQRWVDKYEEQGEMIGNLTLEAANRRISNNELRQEVRGQAKIINKLDGEVYELRKVIDQQADEVNHLEAQLDSEWANDTTLGELEDMGDAARHQINELMSTLDNIRTMR